MDDSGGDVGGFLGEFEEGGGAKCVNFSADDCEDLDCFVDVGDGKGGVDEFLDGEGES